MNKLPRFTRNEYNALRKMDRRDTEQFIVDVHNKAYEAGYEDGKKAAPDPEPVDLSGLEDEIQKIRGIGGSKARLVSDVVKNYLESKMKG